MIETSVHFQLRWRLLVVRDAWLGKLRTQCNEYVMGLRIWSTVSMNGWHDVQRIGGPSSGCFHFLILDIITHLDRRVRLIAVDRSWTTCTNVYTKGVYTNEWKLTSASRYLGQCWHFPNWITRNLFQWHWNQNNTIFMLTDAFQNIFKMAAILSRIATDVVTHSRLATHIFILDLDHHFYM